jgi:hypothetical protein
MEFKFKKIRPVHNKPAAAKMKPMKFDSFTLPFLRLLATRYRPIKKNQKKSTKVVYL